MLSTVAMVRLPMLLALAVSTLAVPGQKVLDVNRGTFASSDEPRKLTGRFLHITDFHPDQFYKVHSDIEDSCHSGKGLAGTFGAEVSDCDSPIALANQTLDWVRDNLRDKIDFVIWTGDNARHDNDENHPRNSEQVLGTNRLVAAKMFEAFATDTPLGPVLELPIVPTFGNNDFLPHNIMVPGPNRWFVDYADIWGPFIPEVQRHQFEYGGWFYTEVVPNKLVVFSLNTMFFFERNAAVDGCALASEPGYKHMEWLRVQLQRLRDSGMKAILMGHVPPARTNSKQNWDETCWQRYTLWLKQYRDVVIGSLFGHMNIDHFVLQDTNDLDEDSILARGDNIGGKWAERYQISVIGPSVIPNYFPTMRVYEYNITGIEDNPVWKDVHGTASTIQGAQLQRAHEAGLSPQELKRRSSNEPVMTEAEFEAQFPDIFEVDDTVHDAGKKKKKKKKGKKRKGHGPPSLTSPPGPDADSPPGPAYMPQTLSWVAFTQYYANLTRINNEAEHSDGEHGVNQMQFEVEYDTRDDEWYQLRDLTVRELLKLAHSLGADAGGREAVAAEYDVNDVDGEDGCRAEDDEDVDTSGKRKKKKKKKKGRKGKKDKKNKLWIEFLRRAFVGTIGDDELEEL
ncbi:Endopolyphosphatase [Beauveria bassiana]|nr:Endopolyphosphatase [Beauveria bassiana]